MSSSVLSVDSFWCTYEVPICRVLNLFSWEPYFAVGSVFWYDLYTGFPSIFDRINYPIKIEGGFWEKWRKWIKFCVNRGKILDPGEWLYRVFFDISSGLQQGDPLHLCYSFWLWKLRTKWWNKMRQYGTWGVLLPQSWAKQCEGRIFYIWWHIAVLWCRCVSVDIH